MSRISIPNGIRAKSGAILSVRSRLRALTLLLTLFTLSAMAFLVHAASLENENTFFPFILNGYSVAATSTTPELTQTPTATSTLNPTPTVTLTPSQTQTQPSTVNVQITEIIYDPEGNTVQGEYVSIKNLASSLVDLTGWTLRDDYNHIFTFPSYSLDPGAFVKIWSEAGSNTATDLYWGSDQPIWNNDTGGCASLWDAFENPIHQFCYSP